MNAPDRKKKKATKSNIFKVGMDSVDYMAFWTTDPTESYYVDLNEFATGTLDEKLFPTRKVRFKGRPELIQELAPLIHAANGASPVGTAKNIKATLRVWWSFFDEIEGESPIRSISDIDELVGFLQEREGMSGPHKVIFLRWVNDAREKLGLYKMHWVTAEAPVRNVDVPKFQHVKDIYHYLKHYMTSVMGRWEEADKLAATIPEKSIRLAGRAATGWTEARSHATYRLAIARLGYPNATRGQYAEMLGNAGYSYAVLGRTTAIAGLYPIHADVFHLFCLFVLVTGWNVSTALELDVKNYLYPHPGSSQHHIVKSFKGRSNDYQFAIGLNKSVRSPGGILQTLIERNAPLRAQLQSELDAAKELLNSEKGNRKLLRHVQLLERKVKSPWLYSHIGGGDSSILSEATLKYNFINFNKTGMAGLICTINTSRPINNQIPITISLDDLRSAYITFIYESSGFSWLVAKFAAGHKNINSLRSYLNKRRYKFHTEKKVAEYGNKLWQEIKIHKRIDSAILYARMKNGEITEQQRAILTNRTRVGTGCSDFQHPPSSVAPDHVNGAGCRIQRCTLCEHAIYFADSCDHLARRLAELGEIRRTISLLSWNESSFQLELENTEVVLSRYPAQKVAEALAFWLEEIRSGRHVIAHQDGAY